MLAIWSLCPLTGVAKSLVISPLNVLLVHSNAFCMDIFYLWSLASIPHYVKRTKNQRVLNEKSYQSDQSVVRTYFSDSSTTNFLWSWSVGSIIPETTLCLRLSSLLAITFISWAQSVCKHSEIYNWMKSLFVISNPCTWSGHSRVVWRCKT